ncbi:hypothetical protein DPEC_G00208930 [Dallia pectoralis]|uniref:Uncharacterized protein n=1 Tax=Dallia pectoralis TaxID=75939 RepID=A0ACC2G5B7_DALPE|nr:hypothetical protein DPEC_G00208930 [Dallia pectoralis]
MKLRDVARSATRNDTHHNISKSNTTEYRTVEIESPESNREEDELCNRCIFEWLRGTLRFRKLEEEAQLSSRRLTKAMEDAWGKPPRFQDREAAVPFPILVEQGCVPPPHGLENPKATRNPRDRVCGPPKDLTHQHP